MSRFFNALPEHKLNPSRTTVSVKPYAKFFMLCLQICLVPYSMTLSPIFLDVSPVIDSVSLFNKTLPLSVKVLSAIPKESIPKAAPTPTSIANSATLISSSASKDSRYSTAFCAAPSVPAITNPATPPVATAKSPSNPQKAPLTAPSTTAERTLPLTPSVVASISDSIPPVIAPIMTPAKFPSESTYAIGLFPQ